MRSLKKKIWVTMICFVYLLAPIGWDKNPGLCNSAELVKSKDDKNRAIAKKKDERSRFALIIGNGNYADVPALSNPINDTKDMKQALKRLNFKVTHLLDVKNRRKMTEAVRKFGENLAENSDSIGLFFYAGHAMQINGINYLIPVEGVIKSETDVEFETFDINYLLRTMNQAKNSMNIIILDACRNNPFARGFRGAWDRGLATMDGPTGSTIVFATAPGKNAEDGSERNGTFTKHLLKHIETPELTIEQMLKQVRLGVHDETQGKQIPWLESSQLGDFCFAGCRDQKAIELDVMQAEEKLAKLAAEQEKLAQKQAAYDQKQAAILAERALLEKKEAKIKAKDTKQPQDQAALAKIHKEQAEQAKQRQLLKEQQQRLSQQEKTASEQRKELQLEKDNIEKERQELARLRKEAEEQRHLDQEARKVDVAMKKQNRKRVMPAIGF